MGTGGRNVFTDAELSFLTGERRLGRLATVGPDGMPHVAPVGWSLDVDRMVVEIGGIELETTKKFRDVARTRRAAIVIDEVLPPWRPRGVEIRGTAEAVGGPDARIVIHPRRVVGWGLDSTERKHNARSVEPATDGR